MFRVGQKVVCIDAKGHRLIKTGQVYTIRQVGLVAWTDGSAAVRLEEICRGPRDRCDGSRGDDTPYYARRFRPVIERKTDISIFTRMLDGVREMAH